MVRKWLQENEKTDVHSMDICDSLGRKKGTNQLIEVGSVRKWLQENKNSAVHSMDGRIKPSNSDFQRAAQHMPEVGSVRIIGEG